MTIVLKAVSDALLLDEQFVNTIAITASKRYKKFQIPKKGGGSRDIHEPSQELKSIQKCLLDTFLSELPIHESAFAYKRGSNIKKHAEVHVENNFLLRLDFKDFFSSIHSIDFYNYVKEMQNNFPKNWQPIDTELLCKLVFKNDKLTIGAVTSAHLSNVLCYEMDKKIALLCSKKNVTYSRYSDDLYFSTVHPDILLKITPEIITIIRELEYPKSLYINRSKTIHSSKKRRRMVTGLIISNDKKVSLGRSKKRELRSLVYKWEGLAVKEKNHLKGTLAYVSDVEPELINQFCKKFGAAKIIQIMKYQVPKTT